MIVAEENIAKRDLDIDFNSSMIRRTINWLDQYEESNDDIYGSTTSARDIIQHRLHWELMIMKRREARELCHDLECVLERDNMEKRYLGTNLNKYFRIPKLSVKNVDVNKFQEFKKNPYKRSEYWQMNYELMQRIKELGGWIRDNLGDNHAAYKNAWNQADQAILNFCAVIGKNKGMRIQDDEELFIKWKRSRNRLKITDLKYMLFLSIMNGYNDEVAKFIRWKRGFDIRCLTNWLWWIWFRFKFRFKAVYDKLCGSQILMFLLWLVFIKSRWKYDIDSVEKEFEEALILL
jgi:hypothetical protein